MLNTYCWAWGLSVSVVNIPSKSLLEKNSFSNFISNFINELSNYLENFNKTKNLTYCVTSDVNKDGKMYVVAQNGTGAGKSFSVDELPNRYN